MKRSEKGVALPLALMAMLIMSVLGVTLYSAGMTEVAIGTNWRAYSVAFYAAEAGIESGVVALRNLLRTPNPCNNSLQAISGTNNKLIRGVSLADIQIITAAIAAIITITSFALSGSL